MSSATQKQNAVEIFLKSWSVYQEIIQHNYMFHREITESVKRWLESFQPGKRLRILDLGCGDASMALPLLSATHVQTYLGCDLSQPALDIAEKKLDAEKIPHQCICDDMLKVVAEQPDESIDLVFSSYALHHLNATQKEQIIKDISRTLKNNGCFMLIDIFRKTGEDRSAYMKNYLDYLRENWINLSKEAQDLVVAHATEYDFPEHEDFYTTLCQKTGLKSSKLIGKHTWHQAWIFNKSMSIL